MNEEWDDDKGIKEMYMKTAHIKNAEIILKELDLHAPVSINMKFKEEWIAAIVRGLEKVQSGQAERRKDET